MQSLFRQRLEQRQAVIGVVGLGYVGLPLVLAFTEQGFRTLGFDIDPQKTEALNRGESYIRHIPSVRIQQMGERGLFEATTDYSRVGEVDVLLICVPTPLTAHHEPDMSYIVATGEAVGAHLREGQLIVLESTTYPGTTREVLQPILEKGGLQCGRDFHLAYSPEREDPGNLQYTTRTIPKVIGGCDAESRERAMLVYSQIVEKVVPVSSSETAEAVKLTENIFRCVNIALVNELKMIYMRMGIDIWEVIAAAETKPFGFMPFYPGPGLGGHCIPIDPFYLSWKAREFDCPTRFIELAGEINIYMPEFVVHRVMEALNEHGKPLRGARILVMGVAYKKNVDDIRESPSLVLLRLLRRRGADAEYHDPYVERIKATRNYPELEGYTCVDLTPEILQSMDAVIIATDHSMIDYAMVAEHSQLIIDTRNVTSNLNHHHCKVVKA